MPQLFSLGSLKCLIYLFYKFLFSYKYHTRLSLWYIQITIETRRWRIMKSNYKVTQSYDLIEARYMDPLTAREKNLIVTMISMIQQEDKEFKEYVISIKDFHEMLDLKGRPHYTQIRGILSGLRKKEIQIPRYNGGCLITGWISDAEIEPGSGEIRLTISEKLKPYLLELGKNFDSYTLSNLLNLKSIYAKNLFELMHKWEKVGKCTFSIELLRGMIGVEDGTYEKYNHLKERVLKRAVEEISEKTDLIVTFEEIKKGRKVDKIEFSIRPHIKQKKIEIQLPKQTPENEDVRIRLNDLANSYSFEQTYFAQMYQGALAIWGDRAEDELSVLIRYVNEEKTVTNPLGFIKAKLTEAWGFHEAGLTITFADLKPSQRRTGRAEKLPEWFKNRSEPKEAKKEIDLNIVEERQKLLKEMGIEQGE